MTNIRSDAKSARSEVPAARQERGTRSADHWQLWSRDAKSLTGSLSFDPKPEASAHTPLCVFQTLRARGQDGPRGGRGQIKEGQRLGQTACFSCFLRALEPACLKYRHFGGLSRHTFIFSLKSETIRGLIKAICDPPLTTRPHLAAAPLKGAGVFLLFPFMASALCPPSSD